MRLCLCLHLWESHLQIWISYLCVFRVNKSLSSFPIVHILYMCTGLCALRDSFSSPGILIKHSHQRCGYIYLREHQTLTVDITGLWRSSAGNLEEWIDRHTLNSTAVRQGLSLALENEWLLFKTLTNYPNNIRTKKNPQKSKNCWGPYDFYNLFESSLIHQGSIYLIKKCSKKWYSNTVKYIFFK